MSDVRRRGVSSLGRHCDVARVVRSIKVSSACRRRKAVVVSDDTGAAVVVASSTLKHESLVDV